MLTILSVAIGIVLVLMLMSILSSTVHDIIASMLSLRGRHLRSTLMNMLGTKAQSFLEHPFFQQLTYADGHKSTLITPYSLPDWVDKATFSAILHDLLQKEQQGENLAEKINSIPDQRLRELLRFLVAESDGTIGGLKDKMENWFGEVMERASAYYQRATKWRLFFIGLVLAAILNADTIGIYQKLSTDSALRDELVQAASQIAAADTLPVMQRDSSLKNNLSNTKVFLSQQLNGLDSSLGLGWNEPGQKDSLPWWLIKLAGFLLTGIAVTFGATFWFNLLKKFLSLRGGGGETGNSESPGFESARGSRGVIAPPNHIDAYPIGDIGLADNRLKQ